jgi:hypothetical protein
MMKVYMTNHEAARALTRTAASRGSFPFTQNLSESEAM